MDDSGFRQVTRLETARERLRAVCPDHGRTATVAVGDADGRILADSIAAARAVPHYDRAAMDGYAVRAADTVGASDRSPAMLDPTAQRVGDGDAVQVHTGSPLPDGADAVVMVEETERRDDRLAVYDSVATGENVAPAGEDVEAGQQLFEAGHRLRSSDLALLRATGRETVEVVERPRVSVLPTGEELVAAGTEPAPGEIVETNGLLVSTLVEQWSGTPTYCDVVTDDEEALCRAIQRDLDHDIVVTTGGSSVGERDLLPDVLAEMGEVLVHGVALKPGHPVGFGVVDDTPVLMLPGYPVSCLVNAVQFLRPAIAWLSGTDPSPLPTTRARLAGKLRSEPGTRTFARVTIADSPQDVSSPDDSGPDGDGTIDLPVAEPVRVSGAGVMSSVAFADGWVDVPASREGIPAGEAVTVTDWEPR